MSGVWQQWPAVSLAGDVIFTQFEPRNSVWSLASGDRGVPLDQIPASVADGVGHFSVSRDGKTLVYGRLTGGTAGELVVRNLATGEQKVFVEAAQFAPAVAANEQAAARRPGDLASLPAPEWLTPAAGSAAHQTGQDAAERGKDAGRALPAAVPVPQSEANNAGPRFFRGDPVGNGQYAIQELFRDAYVRVQE